MAIASYIVSRITAQLNDELSVSLLCPVLLLCLHSGESQPIRIFNSSLICRRVHRSSLLHVIPSCLFSFSFVAKRWYVHADINYIYEGVKGHIIPL
ncbi:hypothetical protein C8J55DRAFT_519681 [Lentinula edodes]|uniref:Uncharacterized protein n=1 Tax=Lentinula lateritia TaxID=40482 RepID=A0A9W9A4H9_9AGAR|nr:hypothetical protein C8J55DRAFT_519681 [Lentinula edodes]